MSDTTIVAGADQFTAPPDSITEIEHVHHRGPSDRTRLLFAEASKSIATQLQDDDGDGLIPAIEDDSPVTPDGLAAPSGAPQGTPPSGVAPALDPAAKAIADRAAVAQANRDAELAKREEALTAREAEHRAKSDYSQRYADSPGAAVREFIKAHAGSTLTAEQLRDEVSDVISELSALELNVTMPDQHRQRLETRKALRKVDSYKAEMTRLEQTRSERDAAERAQREERDAVAGIGREFVAAAAKFPNLSAEDNPAEIIFSVARAKFDANRDHYLSTKTTPTWEECAAIAETFYSNQNDAFIAKRRHLAPAAQFASSPSAVVPQGDPQSRRSSTLSNRLAAPTAVIPPQPVNSDGPEAYDRDAHRRRTLANHAKRFKPAAEE